MWACGRIEGVTRSDNRDVALTVRLWGCLRWVGRVPKRGFRPPEELPMGTDICLSCY